jgi:hypothetical protein
MTNRNCQAVGCYDAIEAHKLYSPSNSYGGSQKVTHPGAMLQKSYPS